MSRQLGLAIAFGSLATAAAFALFVWEGPVAAREAPLRAVPGAALALPDDRPIPAGLEKAIFASGCFWCTESDFDEVEGVVSTTAGYTGGHVPHPTYAQVSSGGTGHVESIEVLFDPTRVSYETLLDRYWHTVDFFNDRGQFCDYGEQYRPMIFVRGAAQRTDAEHSKSELQRRFAQRIVVDIREASVFYPAESYHQDYSLKNVVKYCVYRWSCGRDARIAEIWRQAY